MRKIVSVFAAAALLLLTACSIKSEEEYYNYSSSEPESGSSVTIEIECSQILENMDMLDPGLEEYVPDDGIILEKTEYFIDEGESVYSVLKRAVRDNHIQMEAQGSEENALGTVYVEGINYLYEFSCGSQSGWVYTVNDEYADRGCNSYELSDGDKIKWIYTCSMEGFDL